jgi:hypothetical protein
MKHIDNVSLLELVETCLAITAAVGIFEADVPKYASNGVR